MHSLKAAVFCLAFASICYGQASILTSGVDPPARLPVTRVILYKNGVGYFEHSGHVHGNQEVNVDFTTAQLNDVLKSLTAGEDEKATGKIGLTQISLVSDSGEVHIFDLTPSTTVRVVEKEVNEEVGKYLGLVASTRDQDVRRMTISTAGDGDRICWSAISAKCPFGRARTASSSRTTAIRCCRVGLLSTTPSGRIGRMSTCR